MTFIGYMPGVKGFKFMRRPNNVIFHSATTLFDEYIFPHCPDFKSPGHTRIGHENPNSEDNIPLEDGDWFDGGAYLPNMPHVPAGNIPPQVPHGPQIPPQGAPQPTLQPPAHKRPVHRSPLWMRDEPFRQHYSDPRLLNDDDAWNDYWHSNFPWHRPQPDPTIVQWIPIQPDSPPSGSTQGFVPYQQQPQALPPVQPEPGPSMATQPRQSGRTR